MTASDAGARRPSRLLAPIPFRARERRIAASLLAAASVLMLAVLQLADPAGLDLAAFGLALAGDVASLVALRRRRLRPAACAWLVLSPLRLSWLPHVEPRHLLLPFSTAVAATLLLLAPRLRARSAGEPLPALPPSWVCLAALPVVATDAWLMVGARHFLEGTLFVSLIVAVPLFAALAVAPAGAWGPPVRLVLVGLLAWWQGQVLPASEPWLRFAPMIALALALDGLRSAPSAGGRFARGALLGVAAGLLPPLLVSPSQATGPDALLAIGARAAALGIAVALAPRAAPMRPRRRRPLGPASRPTLAVWLLALGAALATYLVAGELGLAPAAAFYVSTAVPLLAVLRRRAMLGVLAFAPLLLLPILIDRGTAPAWMASPACAVILLLAASPGAARHFARRTRTARPRRPRLELALAGAAAIVLLAASIRVAGDPVRAPSALSGLAGPVPFPFLEIGVPDRPLAAPLARYRAGAALAFDTRGRGTWIADEELDEVALVDRAGRRLVTVPGCTWPAEVVADRDGAALATCRGDGRLLRIGPDGALAEVALGGEPLALALDEPARRVYVGLATGRELVALDADRLAVAARRPLAGDPRDLALTTRGVAVLARRSGELEIVRTPGLDSSSRVRLLVHGRRAWHGQAIAASGDDLVVVHASVDTGLDEPRPSGGYGGGVAAPVDTLVAVLLGGRTTVYPVTSEPLRRIPAIDVTGLALRDGHAWIASRGTGQLLDCMLAGGLPRCRSAAAAPGIAGVAAAGTVAAWAAFDRAVVGGGPEPPIPAGPGRLDPELALGRRLFHDAVPEVSSAGLSCATCHPDGREDGLVWRLQGTRRQTPMLAGRLAGTAPYDWLGSSPTLEHSVRQTIERLHGTGLDDPDVAALARWIGEGLRVPEAPPPAEPGLVAAGGRLFRDPEVGCASCHVPEAGFASAGSEDVGSLSRVELAELRAVVPGGGPVPFNVPSLRFAALTPPYLHDGSAATLEELLESNRDRMGRTSHLTAAERRALAAYLRTL